LNERFVDNNVYSEEEENDDELMKRWGNFVWWL